MSRWIIDWKNEFLFHLRDPDQPLPELEDGFKRDTLNEDPPFAEPNPWVYDVTQKILIPDAIAGVARDRLVSTGRITLNGNGIRYSFPIPQQELCGVTELYDELLIHRELMRAKGESDNIGKISDTSLLTLLKIALHASLMTEEADYSKFTMMVPRPFTPRQPNVIHTPYMKFSHEVALEDTPSTGHRLAKIAKAFRTSAACIDEVDGQLKLLGFIQPCEMRRPDWVSQPLMQQAFVTPGLLIRVDGPGILRVREGGFLTPWTYELLAGQLRITRSYHYPSPNQAINTLIQIMTRRLMSLTADLGLGAYELLNDVIVQNNIIDRMLDYIFTGAIRAGKGGAFVFIPRDSSLEGLVKIKYPVAPLDVIHAISDVFHASQGIYHVLTASKLMDSVDSLVDISQIDGCVVISGDGQFLGFGGVINCEGEVEKEVCVDEYGQVNPIDFKSFGTRHQSAIRLCSRLSGTMVIVISQDGKLRIVESLTTPEKVILHEGLSTPSLDIYYKM